MTHLPRPYLFWILLFMFLVSCTKHTYDEISFTPSEKDLVGSWKVTVFKITSDEQLWDSLLLAGPCIYDNFYLFHADGTYTYEDGADLCGSDAQTPLHTGRWYMQENGTVLQWDDIYWTVEYWGSTMIKMNTVLPSNAYRGGSRLDLILIPY